MTKYLVTAPGRGVSVTAPLLTLVFTAPVRVPFTSDPLLDELFGILRDENGQPLYCEVGLPTSGFEVVTRATLVTGDGRSISETAPARSVAADADGRTVTITAKRN